MMIYNQFNVPKDKIIWGFAYRTDNTEKGMNLKKKPVRGKIVNEYGSYYFYEVNKDDKVIKSKSVRHWSRSYADTYEEAVKGYNEKVNEQIKLLQGLISICKNDLIK